MAGAFSDWGAAAWSEQLPAAKTYALDVLGKVALAHKWTDEWKAAVATAIDTAAASADGWFSDDVPAFWTSAYSAMDAHAVTVKAAGAAVPMGWDKLRNTYASAAGAASSVQEGRAQGTVAAVAKGTAEKSAQDVADVAVAGAKAAGGALTLFKHPGTWVAIATLLVVGKVKRWF